MLPKDRGEEPKAGGALTPMIVSTPAKTSDRVEASSASPVSEASSSPRTELFSVRSDLHPRVTPDDLADALEDVRIAGAALLLEMYVPLPTDTRHLATVLTRRAVAGAEYVSMVRQAAFLADHLADRELED